MIKYKKSTVTLIISVIIAIAGISFAGQGVYLSMKATLAQYLLQEAWIESKHKGQGVPPWPWADTKPLARLDFIQQGLSYIVLEGTSGRSLAFAPGHLTGSALPGTQGHTIISAHRDTHFSTLQKFTENTVFVLEDISNKKHHYQVQEISIIDSRITPLILQPEKGLLTLLTCYPFDAISAGSPYRYKVDAIPIPAFSKIHSPLKL